MTVFLYIITTIISIFVLHLIQSTFFPTKAQSESERRRQEYLEAIHQDDIEYMNKISRCNHKYMPPVRKRLIHTIFGIPTGEKGIKSYKECEKCGNIKEL